MVLAIVLVVDARSSLLENIYPTSKLEWTACRPRQGITEIGFAVIAMT